MHHYIYQIVKDTGEFYVGMRSCKCDPKMDHYFGSGLRLKHAINAHGKEYFRKEILINGVKDRETLARLERQIVTQELVDDDSCYNLKLGGEGGSINGRKFSDATKQKMRVAKKGVPHSADAKVAMSAAKKGRPLSDAHKAAISAAAKTRKCAPLSDAHRRALSAANKGVPKSDATKQKMRVAQAMRRGK